jgi:hypothetical protein
MQLSDQISFIDNQLDNLKGRQDDPMQQCSITISTLRQKAKQVKRLADNPMDVEEAEIWLSSFCLWHQTHHPQFSNG